MTHVIDEVIADRGNNYLVADRESLPSEVSDHS